MSQDPVLTTPAPAKPRLNLPSLKRMAERHHRSILSRPYRSRLLKLLGLYLSNVIADLEDKEHSPEMLASIERDLEAVEVALVHLWISIPYNDSLFVPEKLAAEQIDRLHHLINQAQRRESPLRLAFSEAA